MVDFNEDLVRVGVTGTVYVAPVGTALPTDVTTPLNVAFKSVGFISEDALTEGFSVNSEKLRAWQRPAGLRSLVSEIDWTFKFGMLETSPLSLELFYNGTTDVDTGVATTSIPANQVNVRKAMVVEVEDGDVITRYAIPVVEVGDREEVDHTNSDGTVWAVTVNVMGTSLDDLGTRITNDPGFVALGS